MQTFIPDDLRGKVPEPLFQRFERAFNEACEKQAAIMGCLGLPLSREEKLVAIGRATKLSESAGRKLWKQHLAARKWLRERGDDVGQPSGIAEALG